MTVRAMKGRVEVEKWEEPVFQRVAWCVGMLKPMKVFERAL